MFLTGRGEVHRRHPAPGHAALRVPAQPVRAREDHVDRHVGRPGHRRRRRRASPRRTSSRSSSRSSRRCSATTWRWCSRPPRSTRPLRRRADGVVIADVRYVAEDAVDAIEVEWEPLTRRDGRRAGAGGRRAAPASGDRANTSPTSSSSAGTSRARSSAPTASSPSASTTAASSATAARDARRHRRLGHGDRRDDVLELDPDPPPHPHATTSRRSGSPRSKVRVISLDVGGGFGLKVHCCRGATSSPRRRSSSAAR